MTTGYIDAITAALIDLDGSYLAVQGPPAAFRLRARLAKAAIHRMGAQNSEGFDVFLRSDAAPGSGLGSSSALMVALVGVIKEFRGLAMTAQIVAAVKHAYETQGGAGLDVFAIARAEVEKNWDMAAITRKACMPVTGCR